MATALAELRTDLAGLPLHHVPGVRTLRKSWSKRCRSLPGREVLQLALRLQEEGSSAARFLPRSWCISTPQPGLD